jgi:hypothetical protein
MGFLAPRGIEGGFAYIRNHRKPTRAREAPRYAGEIDVPEYPHAVQFRAAGDRG